MKRVLMQKPAGLCRIDIMRRFFLYAVLLPICLFCACERGNNAAAKPAEAQLSVPVAVLQAGEYPLWFQFSAAGPVLLETIEDALFSAALVPWPRAPHVRFSLAWEEDLVMAVNGGGFIRFSPWGADIGFYRIFDGESWSAYTVGAFVLLEEKPVALLYRDDRFFISDAPLPSPRLWTLDRHSPLPLAFAQPVLDAFEPEDGWDIDVLRQGEGGWFFRALQKIPSQPQMLMLRSGDLVSDGERVSLGAFQNAALPQPLSAAPEPLQEMLAVLFTAGGCRAIELISPALPGSQSYALDRESPALWGFFSAASGSAGGAFILAASAGGGAFFVRQGQSAVHRFSLPPLPEGFVYSGIGVVGDTVIASWEEQDGYSIGAAGFMVLRNGVINGGLE